MKILENVTWNFHGSIAFVSLRLKVRLKILSLIFHPNLTTALIINFSSTNIIEKSFRGFLLLQLLGCWFDLVFQGREFILVMNIYRLFL